MRLRNNAVVSPWVYIGLENVNIDIRDSNYLLKEVAKHYNVKVEDMQSRSRKREFVVPRQVFCYLMRLYTNHGFLDIGGMIGGRDHSTVIHGVQQVSNLLEVDKKFKQKYEDLFLIILNSKNPCLVR